ncbi:MAG: bile acid:sodium symporter family protein [Thermoplasmatota archaeon]
MAELETSVVTDVILPIALAILMFGMGLSTPPRRFVEAAQKPQGLLIGLAGQLLALPLLAVLTVVLFHNHVDRDIAIGILLLGALPGGSTSNVLSHICRGDTALSIILTTITSVLALLTTPLLLLGTTRFLYGDGIDASLPFEDVLGLVLVIITIPVLLGLLVARWKPKFAAASDKPFRIAGIVVLAIVVAGAIYGNREGFWDKAWQSVPAALVLNLLALTAGFGLGSLVDSVQRRSITIEVGFQNGTLGILIATTQLDSASAALVPAFYSLVMFLTGGALAVAWGRKPKETDPATA